MSDSLQAFRAETRDWLEANCPPGARGEGQVPSGSTKVPIEDPDVKLWLERMIEKGWTVPTWPAEYGGAGLTTAELVVLVEEMKRIDARPPLMGMGTGLIGPTLVELGSEDQKRRHLPRIARGEVGWCQGYSEPGAGSDLASLRTRAVDAGDHFVINGQKIWTSGAQFADWMFCLVRTDPDVPKHEGISFVLLPMDQPGVKVKPIKLISGNSPFCETFFDNAIAKKEDLVGELNKGWTVAKRLLQYERSGPSGVQAKKTGEKKPTRNPLAQLALDYVGEEDGRIIEPGLRDEVLTQLIQERAMMLTARRAAEENQSGKAAGAATSIFKYVGSTLSKNGSELRSRLRGTKGLGWEGAGFTDAELESTRSWLRDRAVTIYGGTNEVQLNIIAKRVLGLPD